MPLIGQLLLHQFQDLSGNISGRLRGSSYIRGGSIISAIFTSELRSELLTHLRHFLSHFLSFEVERIGRERQGGGRGGRELNLINKIGFSLINNISLLSLAVITLDSMFDHKYNNTHIVSGQSL